MATTEGLRRRKKEAPSSATSSTAAATSPSLQFGIWQYRALFARHIFRITASDQLKPTMLRFLNVQMESKRDPPRPVQMLKAEPRRHTIIQLLAAMLDGLIANPKEAKARCIPKNDRKVQLILSLDGGIEFIEAIGFRQEMLLPDGFESNRPAEPFLKISMADAQNSAKLLKIKDALITCNELAIKLHLYRCPQVLKMTGDRPMPPPLRLPADFSTLTTKPPETAGAYGKASQLGGDFFFRWDYALIRVCFPDGYALQATFDVTEPFTAVCSLVRGHLDTPDRPFQLRDSTGRRFTEALEGETIAALHLAPTAIIRFDWTTPAVLPDTLPPYIGHQLTEVAEEG